MPRRKTVLATGEFYHIFNRGHYHQDIFFRKKDYSRFVETSRYYQYSNISLKYSHFKSLSPDKRYSIFGDLRKESKKLVDIFAYCLMPNHYHFLLRQIADGGISFYFKQLQSSYVHYLNTRKELEGSLFQGSFKSVRVKTDEQLLHLSRYIHLNPYSSHLVNSFADLEKYPWSSLSEYFGPEINSLSDPGFILAMFQNKESYRCFVLDEAAFQRHRSEIKHLFLD